MRLPKEPLYKGTQAVVGCTMEHRVVVRACHIAGSTGMHCKFLHRSYLAYSRRCALVCNPQVHNCLRCWLVGRLLQWGQWAAGSLVRVLFLSSTEDVCQAQLMVHEVEVCTTHVSYLLLQKVTFCSCWNLSTVSCCDSLSATQLVLGWPKSLASVLQHSKCGMLCRYTTLIT